MKKTLLFATGNSNKVREIRSLLRELPYEVVTMKEMGFYDEIPETGSTLEENAVLKATFLFDKLEKDVIAEDTGLEVAALNGAPGVHTARYAGEERSAEGNMKLLLDNMSDQSERSARFRTVIAYIQDGKVITFEGIVNGTISNKMVGTQGFGYDPIFIPEGHHNTFAEMDLSLKATMSHRSRAMQKLITYLEKQQ